MLDTAGLVGFVLVMVGFAALLLVIFRMLRWLGQQPPPPKRSTCANCGHSEQVHQRGACRYERGDPTWGNDSYGNGRTPKFDPEICGCTTYTA